METFERSPSDSVFRRRRIHSHIVIQPYCLILGNKKLIRAVMALATCHSDFLRRERIRMSSMAAVRTNENPNRNPGSHPSNKSFDAVFVEPPLPVVTTEDLFSPAAIVDTQTDNLSNIR